MTSSLNSTTEYFTSKYQIVVDDYKKSFAEHDGLTVVMQKANDHAKVGAFASVVFACIGYTLCQCCTLGVLPALPFFATCFPVGFISYNVWRVSTNAAQPGALEGSRLDKETRLMKGTKHFGWAVDMILDAEIAKIIDPSTVTLTDADEKKAKIKKMLEQARRCAFAVEMGSASIFLCSYALAKASVILGLISTIGYVTAPVFALVSYGVYYVSDKLHTSIETVERKYPNGSIPEFRHFMLDLASEAVSRDTLMSIFNDCMVSLGFRAPQPVVAL